MSASGLSGDGINTVDNGSAVDQILYPRELHHCVVQDDQLTKRT